MKIIISSISTSAPPNSMFNTFLDVYNNLIDYIEKLWIFRGGCPIESRGGIVVISESQSKYSQNGHDDPPDLIIWLIY